METVVRNAIYRKYCRKGHNINKKINSLKSIESVHCLTRTDQIKESMFVVSDRPGLRSI